MRMQGKPGHSSGIRLIPFDLFLSQIYNLLISSGSDAWPVPYRWLPIDVQGGHLIFTTLTFPYALVMGRDFMTPLVLRARN